MEETLRSLPSRAHEESAPGYQDFVKMPAAT
jgi:hypothetical protein